MELGSTLNCPHRDSCEFISFVVGHANKAPAVVVTIRRKLRCHSKGQYHRGRNVGEFLAFIILDFEPPGDVEIISWHGRAASVIVDRTAFSHDQSDRRNSSIACRSDRLRSLNSRTTLLASPRCRRIASVNVTDSPSCISRARIRTAHSGGVRILLRVCCTSLSDRPFQSMLYTFLP